MLYLCSRAHTHQIHGWRCVPEISTSGACPALTTSSILLAHHPPRYQRSKHSHNCLLGFSLLIITSSSQINNRTCSVCLFFSARHGCFQPLDDSDAHILLWRSFCDCAVKFLTFEPARARKTLRVIATYINLLSCHVVTEAFLSNAVCQHASLTSVCLVVSKPDACKL